MGKTYEATDQEVRGMMHQVMEQFHGDLLSAGVSVSIVFVSSIDKNGEEHPTLKVRGMPASAKIGITSLEERARGVADAKMVIDHFTWAQAGEHTRQAILDHELTHLVLSLTVDNLPVLDDLGRPKLGLRFHDWEVWGFEQIAQRYGVDAPEVMAAQQVIEKYGQVFAI